MSTRPPDETPFCVDAGWQRSVFIPNTLGPSYRLLFYSDTDVGFEHRCDRGERGVIICAPRLTNVGQPGGHQLHQADDGALTVEPSILCPDCGTHGFVRNGRWAG